MRKYKLNSILTSFQGGLSRMTSHPLATVAGFAFLFGWVLGHFASGGKFDSDWGMANLLINWLGFIIMLAVAGSQDNHADTVHERLDALHAHLDDVHASIKGSTPTIDGKTVAAATLGFNAQQ